MHYWEMNPNQQRAFRERVGPPTETGCRLWQGSIMRGGRREGYGRYSASFPSDTKNKTGRYSLYKCAKAHRLSYERWYGPIPEGLELHHICRTRACVEPTHLTPVTHAENVSYSQRPKT